MFKRKIDGVVETVKYREDGNIDWVRGYERRDMSYSDVIILDREELLQRLQEGKLIYTGKRKQYLGSSFDQALKIELVDQKGQKLIQTEGSARDHDFLEGVPIQ